MADGGMQHHYYVGHRVDDERRVYESLPQHHVVPSSTSVMYYQPPMSYLTQHQAPPLVSSQYALTQLPPASYLDPVSFELTELRKTNTKQADELSKVKSDMLELSKQFEELRLNYSNLYDSYNKIKIERDVLKIETAEENDKKIAYQHFNKTYPKIFKTHLLSVKPMWNGYTFYSYNSKICVHTKQTRENNGIFIFCNDCVTSPKGRRPSSIVASVMENGYISYLPMCCNDCVKPVYERFTINLNLKCVYHCDCKKGFLKTGPVLEDKK